MTLMPLIRLALAGGVFALSACGASSDPNLVTESQYGDKWPLTVGEARLDCESPAKAILIADSKTYALNGEAIRAGYLRWDAIGKPGAGMFPADFVEKAMHICIEKRKQQ